LRVNPNIFTIELFLPRLSSAYVKESLGYALSLSVFGSCQSTETFFESIIVLQVDHEKRTNCGKPK
jgi:hypothetical protein